MNLSYLKNHDGVTLVELVVAMAITSMLLIFIVSGSLFVQNYIDRWRQKDVLGEELAFLQTELSSAIRNGRSIRVRPDSLVLTTSNQMVTIYTLSGGRLYRNNKQLTRPGVRVDCLNVNSFELPHKSQTVNLREEGTSNVSGLYRLVLCVSDRRGNADTLSFVIRNSYEYFKHH